MFGPEREKTYRLNDGHSRTLGDVFGPERALKKGESLKYSRTLGDVFGPELITVFFVGSSRISVGEMEAEIGV